VARAFIRSDLVADVDSLWTGGCFAPEALIATVVLGLLVGAALLALAKRRAWCVAFAAQSKRPHPARADVAALIS
jgi:hypothetical protein